MEARVDLRKLQLLNDRVNQAIEALNQVRLSVHAAGSGSPIPPQSPVGLSHAPTPPVTPFGAIPIPVTPYGPVPPSGYAGPHGHPHPTSAPVYGIPVTPWAGLQHASYGYGWSSPPTGWPQPGTWTPPGSPSPDHYEAARAQDPHRMTQTFPYCFSPVSPYSQY